MINQKWRMVLYSILTVRFLQKKCVDDSHALVLEGFLYGTGVNITCSLVCLLHASASAEKQ